MIDSEEIKKVLGNDEKSRKKLKELLQMLENQPQTNNTSDTDTNNNENNNTNIPEELLQKKNVTDHKQLLKQKLQMMKVKRMNNSGKKHIQSKMMKKINKSK